jgi:hypothetical protein
MSSVSNRLSNTGVKRSQPWNQQGDQIWAIANYTCNNQPYYLVCDRLDLWTH